MAPQQVVATVASVKGKAFACSQDGKARPVKPGDPLLDGEKIVTKPGGSVVLVPEEGAPFAIDGDQVVSLTPDVGGPCDQEDVAMPPDALADAIAALQPNRDFGDLDNIEPPGIGPAGGGGGGHNFLRLLHIVQTINPLSFGFGTSTESYFASGLAGTGSGSSTPPISLIDTNPDGYEIVEGETVHFEKSVLENDGQPAGTVIIKVIHDNVTYNLVNGEVTIDTQLGGKLTVYADGTFDYTAPVRDHGNNGHVDTDGPDVEHFQYIASNSTGESRPTTVDIDILDTVPFAVKDHYEVVSDTGIEVLKPDGLLFQPVADVDSADGGTEVYEVRVNGVVTRVSEGTVFTTEQGGTVTISPDGSLTYKQPPGYVGPDRFEYRDVDSDGSFSNWAAVTFDVHGSPTNPDNYDIVEGETATFESVLANDLAPNTHVSQVIDSNGVHYAVPATGSVEITTGLGGVVKVYADGTFEYTAPVRDHGNNGHVDTDGPDVDHFQYIAANSTGESAPTEVDINILDTEPFAVKDHYEVVSDTGIDVSESDGLLFQPVADVASADGGTKVYEVKVNGVVTQVSDGTVFTTEQGGTVTINSDGSLSYKQPPGYVGPDRFEYRDVDGDGSFSNWAAVTFDVHGSPTNPDNYDIVEGETATFESVLANDLAPNTHVSQVIDSNGVHYAVPATGSVEITTGLGGVVKVYADGTFEYTAPVRDHGNNGHVDADGPDVDHFQYIAANSTGESAPTEVDINILDTEPFAVKDHYEVVSDTGIDVPKSDGLLFQPVADVDSADGGTKVYEVKVNGVVTQVSDGTVFTTEQGGTVTINSDGSLSYKQPPGYVGPDRFEYRDVDGDGSYSNWAAVTFDVHGSPTTADNYEIVEGETATFESVLANDTAPNAHVSQVIDGNGVHYTVPATGGVEITTGFGGKVTVYADGTFEYTAPVRDHGDAIPDVDSFQYIAANSTGESAPTEVNINILDTVPFAVKDHYEVVSDTGLHVAAPDGLLFQPVADIDSKDGGTIVFEVRVNGVITQVVAAGTTFTTEQGGTVTINPDGSLDYQQPAGYVGPDRFEYRDVDSDNSTGNWAAVTFDVHGSPTTADNYDIVEGETTTFESVLANDPAPNTHVSQVVDGKGEYHTVPATGGVEITTAFGATVKVYADGTFDYTAPVRDHGDAIPDVDHFQYIAANSTGESALTDVNINITDTVPFAVKDHYEVVSDTGLHVDAPDGLLLQPVADIDSKDGGTTVFEVKVNGVVTPVIVGVTFVTEQGGSVTINPDGSLDYQQPAGYVGPDRFEYRDVDSDNSVGNWAAVTFDVYGSPTTADNYDIREGDTTSFESVLANDAAPNTHVSQVVDGNGVYYAVPATGGVEIATAFGATVKVYADGTFDYTAPVRDHRDAIPDVDHFQYIAANSTGESALTDVNINITDTEPFAIKDHYDAQSDKILHVSSTDPHGLFANDVFAGYEPQDLPVVVSGVRVNGVVTEVEAGGTTFNTVQGGTVTINPDGSFDYAAPQGGAAPYAGPDKFEYQATDSDGSSSRWEAVEFDVKVAQQGGPGADTIVGGSDYLTLTGGEDADVFQWQLSDLTGDAKVTNVITDFNPSEGDKLDLRDLLTDGPDLLLDNSHLDVTFDGTSTKIAVTPVDTSAPELDIIIKGVDLTDGNTYSGQDAIDNLVKSGTLIDG